MTSKTTGSSFDALKRAQEAAKAMKSGKLPDPATPAAAPAATRAAPVVRVNQPNPASRPAPAASGGIPGAASAEPRPSAAVTPSSPSKSTSGAQETAAPASPRATAAPASPAPAAKAPAPASQSSRDRFAALALAHARISRGDAPVGEARDPDGARELPEGPAKVAQEAMARIMAEVDGMSDWARKPPPDVQIKIGRFFRVTERVLRHYKASEEEMQDMRRKGLTGTLEDLDWLIDWHEREWRHIRFMTDDAYAVSQVIQETPRFRTFFEQYGLDAEADTGAARRPAR